MERKAWLVALLAIVLLLPVANGIVGGGSKLFLVANAPEADDGMFVSITRDPGIFGSCGETATVEVLREQSNVPEPVTVFPGLLGKVEMDGCEGQLKIPYDRFADKNTQYIVHATYDGHDAETRIFVNKVVNWVYVRTFNEPEHERVRVEMALDRIKAKPLESSIFSSGTLEIDIRFEQCANPLVQLPISLGTETCNDDVSRSVLYEEIPVNQSAALQVLIPWQALEGADQDGDGNPEDGWYNVTATFHNDEAKGNKNVPQDPSTFQEDPPGNWFEVDYE